MRDYHEKGLKYFIYLSYKPYISINLNCYLCFRYLLWLNNIQINK